MSMPKDDIHYTYNDYYSWNDGKRLELIDGVPYTVPPAPNQFHQEILVELSGQFREYLKGKSAKVFITPFDVRLNPKGKDDTVVQPDLIVVSDMSKLDGKCCRGNPDLIVEITSPATNKKDTTKKFNKYMQSDVKEYWVVYPETNSVQVFILKDGLYYAKSYSDDDKVPVEVLPGLEIDLYDVFNG